MVTVWPAPARRQARGRRSRRAGPAHPAPRSSERADSRARRGGPSRSGRAGAQSGPRRAASAPGPRGRRTPARTRRGPRSSARASAPGRIRVRSGEPGVAVGQHRRRLVVQSRTQLRSSARLISALVRPGPSRCACRSRAAMTRPRTVDERSRATRTSPRRWGARPRSRCRCGRRARRSAWRGNGASSRLAVALAGLSPRPHGQGLVAATSMKRQGSSTAWRARTIVTRPSSSGWRRASSASRENSPSSSRNRTPRWASVTSPGRGGEPPPTSPAVEIVWWGARNGRAAVSLRARGPAAGARDPQHLHRLGAAERGHDRRQAARGERLAGAGRTNDQQAVTSGGRHLERVQKDGCPRRSARSGGSGPEPFALQAGGEGVGGSPSVPRRPAARLGQGNDPRRAGKGRLGRVRAGTAIAPAQRPCRLRHRQHSRHGADRAVERELAREREPASLSAQSCRRRQNRGRDRQVEARAGLAQIRGRKVGGDPLLRELEARVLERGPHPLARLPDRRSGRPTSEKPGSPPWDVGPRPGPAAPRSRGA